MAAALPWWRKHIDRPVDTHIGSHSSWRVADGIEWLPYAAAIAAAYCGADAKAPIADRALPSLPLRLWCLRQSLNRQNV